MVNKPSRVEPVIKLMLTSAFPGSGMPGAPASRGESKFPLNGSTLGPGGFLYGCTGISQNGRV